MGGISNILFSLDRSIPLKMRRRIPIKKAGGMVGDLYLVKKPRNKVCVMVNMGEVHPSWSSWQRSSQPWDSNAWH